VDGRGFTEQARRGKEIDAALNRLIYTDPDQWAREDIITVVMAAAAHRSVLTSISVDPYVADPDEPPWVARYRQALADFEDDDG
jgi:hypothetical protein